MQYFYCILGRRAALLRGRAVLLFLALLSEHSFTLFYHPLGVLSIMVGLLAVIGINSWSVTLRAVAILHNVENFASALPVSIFTICILSICVISDSVLIVYPLSVLSFLICSPSIINSSVIITLGYYRLDMGQHVKKVDDYHT